MYSSVYLLIILLGTMCFHSKWSINHPLFILLYVCQGPFKLTSKVISSIQLAKTRPGADCGSDHQLLIAKFRLKLKKVGKPTKQFRHDLNQISYDYTVEVTNIFKGLDLVDRVPEELWMGVFNIGIGWESMTKTIQKKKKCKKAKWLPEKAL